jgi:hypothetical protein
VSLDDLVKAIKRVAKEKHQADIISKSIVEQHSQHLAALQKTWQFDLNTYLLRKWRAGLR